MTADPADAESRLRAWLRDHSDQKQPAFVADLEALLAEAARLRAELDDLQRQIRDAGIERDLMD